MDVKSKLHDPGICERKTKVIGNRMEIESDLKAVFGSLSDSQKQLLKRIIDAFESGVEVTTNPESDLGYVISNDASAVEVPGSANIFEDWYIEEAMKLVRVVR